MKLNSPLWELLGVKRVRNKVFGVEIEVEGNNFPPVSADTNFKTELDGSLRAGIEYVSLEPKLDKDMKKDVENLQRIFDKTKAVIVDSPRAGVHIHINCQELTMLQFYTFLTLYYILENSIIRNCGKARVGNLFCLRLEDAMQIKGVITNAAADRNIFNLNTRGQYRYGALNMDSLFSYGSVEFRALRTPTNLNIINDWIDFFSILYDSSLDFANPTSVIEEVSKVGYKEFLKTVLKDKIDFLNPLFVEEDIQSGIWNIQSFAYCTEWK
jgi:hypothetical protein